MWISHDMLIEIEHKLLEQATLKRNDQEIQCQQNIRTYQWEILPECDIEIFFRPWKIDPLLRLDGFLIDKWLADVLLMDHAMKFRVTGDFFDLYHDRDMQGRLDSLGPNPSPITVDRVLGRNLHRDMVEKIKIKLHEKSHIS